jgi:hypothetical protein
MTGPVVNCPFRLCWSRPVLVVEQAQAGDDESTVTRIPAHQIDGPASTFGTCPASLLLYPLSAYDKGQLVTQARALARIMRERQSNEPDASRGGGDRPPHPSTPRVDPTHPFNLEGYNGPPKRPTPGPVRNYAGFAGQGVVPLTEGPHAGPGAGRASNPHPPTARDIVEVVPPNTQGSESNMSDDLRSQLISLTNLAIEGFGQQQEQCAGLTAVVDGTIAALIESLRQKQEATHQLAVAAVGGGSSIPDAAANMVGASAALEQHIRELTGASALLKQWTAAVHAYAGAAAAHGRDYLAQI